MLSFLILLLVSQACLVRPQQPKNIFILAGQSNMAGRGGVINDTTTRITTWDGVVPPQCQPNPSVFRLSKNLMWVQAKEPLHADIDAGKTNGIGPGMAFANAVLARDPSFGKIGLVPCAIGGTNLSEWERGSVLYEKMLRRATVALQGGGTIRGMLWCQGESDTLDRRDAVLYKKRLQKFFMDVGVELHSPMLPIFQMAITSGLGPYVDKVREAQFEVDLPNVHTVDANGLPLEPDGLHLTTSAQVQLGQMLANAFFESIHKPVHISSNAAGKIPNLICDFMLGPFLLMLLLISHTGLS